MNHSEEWEAVEEALREECSQVTHSLDGLCPCCGSQLIVVSEYDDSELGISAYSQECPYCDWQSVTLYDA